MNNLKGMERKPSGALKPKRSHRMSPLTVRLESHVLYALEQIPDKAEFIRNAIDVALENNYISGDHIIVEEAD